jgi:hypothetical protein
VIPLRSSAQITHNLDVVWKCPCQPNCYIWGRALTSGDWNGDGHSGIAFLYDSSITETSGVDKVRIYNGGPQGLDTVPAAVIVSSVGDLAVLNRPHDFESRAKLVHHPSEREGVQRFFDYVYDLGDINGDGFDDLALTDDYYGRVYIYFGGTQMHTSPDITLENPEGDLSYLVSPVVHGDLNGDGYQDLAISGFNNAKCRVYVYHGGPHPDTVPDIVLCGSSYTVDAFGGLLACGNLCNDRYSDLIVADYKTRPAGCIYVYAGGSPMDTAHVAFAVPPDTTKQIGDAGGIDVLNRDGEPGWIVAGAYGVVYVYYGSDSMRGSLPVSAVAYSPKYTDFGDNTQRAGRIDGGPYDGFVTGAPYDYQGLLSTAYVWSGPRWSFDTVPSGWLRASELSQDYGWTSACAGDIYGDGKDEVILGNEVASPDSMPCVYVCRFTGDYGVPETNGGQDAARTIRVQPNPCSQTARLTFSSSGRDAVLKIRDLAGRTIRVLRTGGRPAGELTATWDLRDEDGTAVASGVYFVEVGNEGRGQHETAKIVVRPERGGGTELQE